MPNSEKSKAAAASAAHAEHVDRFRWFILLGLITAAMMEILDTTIINVALPQMAGNLGAPPTVAEIGPDGAIHVELLPTFVGCPAIEVIKSAVKDRLQAFGRPMCRSPSRSRGRPSD